MKKLSKKVLPCIFTAGIAGLALCTTSQITLSQADSSKESTYQEIEKDERLYVFASPTRKADFEKSGELGKGIIKIGHGRNGETVIFDSEEAIIEYESRIIKELLKGVDVKVYKEVNANDRLYVFTSPTRKTNFEKSGEMGMAIAKIGYGPNGETVVFDSDDAVREYDNRHARKEAKNESTIMMDTGKIATR